MYYQMFNQCVHGTLLSSYLKVLLFSILNTCTCTWKNIILLFDNHQGSHRELRHKVKFPDHGDPQTAQRQQMKSRPNLVPDFP